MRIDWDLYVSLSKLLSVLVVDDDAITVARRCH